MLPARLRSAIVTLGLFLSAHAAYGYGTPSFPCPPQLEPRVGFWIRIFSEYSTDQRVIHDTRYPWVIYEVIDVAGMDQRRLKARVESRKSYYGALLERLAVRRPADYNLEEKRVAGLLAGIPEGARYTRARERIRSQPGIKEQFQLGIRRSGRYLDTMLAMADSLGVPPAVVYLPHVESSFHPGARSKAAATGLWQFTKSTGRRFLRIDGDLDERLDPYCATGAAMRYLQEAYQILGSWPLAVTAYNHGVAGMIRAKARLGEGDFVKVLLEYDGPYFGFASQNFYCEFLAAVEVAGHYQRYFGPLALDPPLVLDSYRLPHYVRVPALARAFGLTLADLAELNPAIGRSCLQGSRPLPRGYLLRLPVGQGKEAPIHYASIPPKELMDKAPPPSGYKVRPGDTLSQIARRYRTSVGTLRRLNNIDSRGRIYPGQVLILPDHAWPDM